MNFLKLAALLPLLTVITARAQFSAEPHHVTASLVADTTAIVPGQPFRIGLVLKIEQGWHTYWQYPGDAGSPAGIKWGFPPGFSAGPIQWPVPRTMDESGLQTYAYSDEVMLIQTITSPADLKPGVPLQLKADANWLVCAEICVPENQAVTLMLPVATSAEPANAAEFEKWTRQVPVGDTPPFAVTWTRDAKNLVAKITPPAGTTAVEFFPLPTPEEVIGHTFSTKSADGSFLVGVESKTDLRGVIAIRDASGERGWEVTAIHVASAPKSFSLAELLGALGFGFLGGLILNLMPCVLPVISLKIFGFVRQAGQSRSRIALHGLAFSAGVFAFFLALGALISTLKAGGTDVTWAFQFQNSTFILILAATVFVFALNLFGIFELTLPGRATTALSEAGAAEGYGGSFFQGAFATLLATPCTAPFLGYSLGFAFSQSAPIIMLMFASVAAGMSLPYLALSLRPGWVKYLPKPGAWMERLKQFMGFPLLATLIWLLSVYGAQRGMPMLIAVSAFLLTLGLALWIYGIASSPVMKTRSRVILQLLAAVIAIGGAWTFLFPHGEKIEWVPYSKAEVDKLLAANKPVFIDFTAEWCLSCKVNERTSIDIEAVRKKMKELGVVPVKADWTSQNPEITAALQQFGRVGVPFYVLYPAGKPDSPITLPEVLTPSLVLDALSKAK
jgi:thiol:disulfide interchange protein/DsbC/DsbD-like thiol-disulfide interchange protein